MEVGDEQIYRARFYAQAQGQHRNGGSSARTSAHSGRCTKTRGMAREAN